MANEVVRSALRRHAEIVDQTVTRFLDDLDHVVAAAQATLQQDLLARLTLDRATHKVLRTTANQRVMRKLPQLWQQALDDAGLSDVIARYLAVYPQQIPAFKDILHAVNHNAKNPLPLPDFAQADYDYFHQLTVSAGTSLNALVESAAATAVTKTVYTLGTVGFRDLTERIVNSTAATLGRAETIANTSLQMFYRSVSGNGFERIQKRIKQELTYRYLNPRDAVTRPFCLDLLDKDQAYTREQIEGMDNDQDLDAWTSCGGFNCRGSWIPQPVL